VVRLVKLERFEAIKLLWIGIMTFVMGAPRNIKNLSGKDWSDHYETLCTVGLAKRTTSLLSTIGTVKDGKSIPFIEIKSQ